MLIRPPPHKKAASWISSFAFVYFVGQRNSYMQLATGRNSYVQIYCMFLIYERFVSML